MSEKYKQTIQELASLRRKVLIRFNRPFDAGSTEGYLLDAGPEFFLIANVADTIRFDGFSCFRYKDVRKLQVPAKFAPFIEDALKKRGERVPRKPKVKLSTVNEILLTSAHVFPLVTIHRERVAPDICHIGQIEGVSNSKVALVEIGPDAIWEDGLTTYSLKEITQVQFGGGYEEALILVGGEPGL
jgi:hypothetical protein